MTVKRDTANSLALLQVQLASECMDPRYAERIAELSALGTQICAELEVAYSDGIELKNPAA